MQIDIVWINLCLEGIEFLLTHHPPPPPIPSRLSTPPADLDDLSNSLDLLENLQTSIPNIEAQFEPLHDQFNILRKYEVTIPDEVELQLERLQGNWMAFQQCLIDSDGMLKKHKEKFRTGLLHSADDFKKTISTLVDQFDTTGPFSDEVSISGAMDFICRMRAEVSQLKMNENNIRRGLNIFKIEQPPSHLIQAMERVRTVHNYVSSSSIITASSSGLASLQPVQ